MGGCWGLVPATCNQGEGASVSPSTPPPLIPSTPPCHPELVEGSFEMFRLRYRSAQHDEYGVLGDGWGLVSAFDEGEVSG